MNAEQLLEHYDKVADAPDVVARLRKFVLDLAVRGKLVEQDANEPAATELLQQIIAHKRKTASRKSTGSAALKPVSPNLAPFELPSGWVCAKFGDIVISRDGERIPVSKEERNGRAKVFDYYGASGVIDKIDAFLFDKPLLLIGEDGANLINRSTPIAFIARGKYWVNNHAHVLDGLSLEFLQYVELFINSTDLKPYVTGSAQPKMNQTKMNSIPVALPPLGEQKRILAKFDELMALCDRLEDARAEREATRDRLAAASFARLNAPDPDTFRADARFALSVLPDITARADQIKQLRQTILNLAVRGKLVAQDAKNDDGAKISASIRHWRERSLQSGRIRESRKPLGPISESERPYSLPTGWIWSRLGSVVYVKSGDGLTAAEMKPGPIPVFGGNGINGYHTSHNVSEPTIAIGRVGFYCGSIHLTPSAAWVTDNAFIVSFPAEVFDLHFLRLLLGATDLKFNESATAQPVISGSKINPIVLGIPPLDEQRAIVEKVRQFMAICVALESVLSDTRAVQAHFFEALLHYTIEAAKHDSAYKHN